MVRGAHCRQHRQVAGSTTEGIVRAVRCSKGPEIEGGTNGSGTSHAVKTDCCNLWGWRRGLLRVYAPSVNDAQFPVGQQEAGRHAGFTQQSLQPLVRRSFPAFKHATLLGIDAAALDANEDLLPLVWVGHRPMWHKICVALLHADGQIRGQWRPTGDTRHLRRAPA
jgi:hypothetical protein